MSITKVKMISHTAPSLELIEYDIKDIQDLVAYCARISNPNNQYNTETSKRLLNYLIKHKHWSPFEMANVCMEITTTRDIARQILRHRSFSFQEYCIDEDSEIWFDLPNKIKKGKKQLYKRKIKDLYKTWKHSEYNKNRIKNMNVRIYDENKKTLTHSNINNIFYTGKREVYKITLKSGKYIISTKDHKFLTENGFDTLENIINLSLNNNTATMKKKAKIAINGIPIHHNKEWFSEAKKRSIKNKTGLNGIAEEAGISYHTARKWIKKHNLQFTKKEVASYTTVWNKGKFGYKTKPDSEETRNKKSVSANKGAQSNLWKGGVNRKFRQQVTDYIAKHRNQFFKKFNYSCNKCNSNINLELHHKIPVYQNKSKAFDLNNIEVLCKECHTSWHKKNGDYKANKTLGNKKYTIKYDEIINIEYMGIKDTYDLEINHNSHNYVANGIITHNSQRYANPTKDLTFVTREARLQDEKNRQNSIEVDNETLERIWKGRQQEVLDIALETYNWAIENGIAKEQARAVLPEGMTVSKVLMNGTIRSWIHYIELRSDNGTQKEHREVALSCMAELINVFPMMKEEK